MGKAGMGGETTHLSISSIRRNELPIGTITSPASMTGWDRLIPFSSFSWKAPCRILASAIGKTLLAIAAERY